MAKGKLEHIHVEPDTEKGATGAHVTWRKKEGEGKNAGPWLRTEREERKSHPTAEAAGAHVTQLLKDHFGGKADDGGARFREPQPNAGKTKANVSHPSSDDGPNPSSDSF